MNLLTVLTLTFTLCLCVSGKKKPSKKDGGVDISSPEVQKIIKNFLNDVDTDFDNIKDMDEALEKLEILSEMTRIASEAQAQGVKIPKLTQDGTDGVLDFLKNWSKMTNGEKPSKYSIGQQHSVYDFKKVVERLMPHLNSGVSLKKCQKIFYNKMVALMGPITNSLGDAVVKPLCEGALWKFENSSS